MKRSAIQCVAGVVGATLVAVGVVWTCRQLTSPTQLNAAGVAPEKIAAPVRQISKTGAVASAQTVRATALPPSRPSSSASSAISSAASTPKAMKGASTSGVRSTNGSSLRSASVSSKTASDSNVRSRSAIRQTSGGELGLSFLEENADAPETGAAPAAEPSFEPDVAPTELSELSDLRYEDSSNAVASGLKSLADANGAPNVDESFAPLSELDSNEPTEPSTTGFSPSDFESPAPAALVSESAPLEPFPAFDETDAADYPAEAPESARRSFDDALVSEPVSAPTFPSLADEPISTPPTSDSFARPLVETPLADATLANETFGTAVPGPAELEGPQTARIVVEKTAPAETQIDQEATIVVKIENVGDATARGVSLRDALPAGARFVSANPPVSPNENGEFVWDAFDLAPKEARTFEYRLIPTQEGEFGGVATATFTASASSRTRCVKPELTVEVGVAKEATLGDKLDFEIVVSNVGSGAARDVSLLETIPGGLKHPGGAVLNNKLGTIQPGETKRLPLTLQCAAAGATVNRLVVTAAGGIEKTVESEIKILAPVLELSIDGPATTFLERDATYRLKARNAGNASAKDVKLVAKLPVGTAFVAANNLGVYKEDARSVYWDLAELPVGSEGEIELTLKSTQMGASSLVFEGTGPNDLSAQASQDVAIDGLPALSFSVKASPDPVEIGKEVEYVVQIVNRGTKASTNVLLQIVAPESMKIVSSDGPTTSRNVSGATVFDKIREVPAKSSVSYKVRAVASVAGDCRLGFQLSSDDLQPLVKEENTRAY